MSSANRCNTSDEFADSLRLFGGDAPAPYYASLASNWDTCWPKPGCGPDAPAVRVIVGNPQFIGQIFEQYPISHGGAS